MTRILNVRVIPSLQYQIEYDDVPLEELPTYDNTKLVAINTCPLWGISRYTHHKTFEGMGRAMALEAGAAAHEVFAAHRLYCFAEFGPKFYETDEATIQRTFTDAGRRIFGDVRFEEMVRAVDESEDFRTRCQQFSLTALYNCGFYDDPGDKRRTTTNIEEMCIAYMDKYDWRNELPYWDGNEFVGIEIPVDVVMFIQYEDDSDYGAATAVIRFIGKADGVHYASKEREAIRVHENKTASRLGDAWEMSWETNHQPTGYMIALTAITGMEINQSVMLGTCLPLPKAYAINGLSRVIARRAHWQFAEWFDWLLHTHLIHEKHKDDPMAAPMYTHSCNRYFRPCSFIPLCAEEPDVRREMFDTMTKQEWSPLHKAGEATDE